MNISFSIGQNIFYTKNSLFERLFYFTENLQTIILNILDSYRSLSKADIGKLKEYGAY